MNKSFSFNFNTNLKLDGKNVFAGSADSSKNLSPQQEYWLNRFLREYGNKVFLLAMLFMAFIFVVVILASRAQTPGVGTNFTSGSTTSTSSSTSNATSSTTVHVNW